jgi:hypothetical protein
MTRYHNEDESRDEVSGLLTTLIAIQVTQQEALTRLSLKLDTAICVLERISRQTCETVNEAHAQTAIQEALAEYRTLSPPDERRAICAVPDPARAVCDRVQRGEVCCGAEGTNGRRCGCEHCAVCEPAPGEPVRRRRCEYEPCEPKEEEGGSAESTAGSAEPQRAFGAPFPPAIRTDAPDDDANEFPAPDVPLGPFRGFPTPGQAITPLKFLSGEGAGDNPDPVVFGTYTNYGTTAAPLSPVAADVSGAEAGSVVLASGNWYAIYSTDGGTTFTSVDPTTIFDNTADGGFCCDQIIQYVPRIDRFLWLMQFSSGKDGRNRLRLAAASPETVVSSKCTSWTYWDLTSDALGVVTTAADAALANPIHWLDYPNMSVGDNHVYLSIDNVGNGGGSPPTGGRIIVRIPLSEIQAGGTINYRYTDWAKGGLAYAGHVTQNTGDEAYWAGNRNNSTLQVFNWNANSTSYSWRDVGVNSWPNGTLSSIAANGSDWLTKAASFPGFGVIGATRKGNEIWLAWTASSGVPKDGSGNPIGGAFNFPNANIQVVRLDPTSNYKRLDQFAIWNNAYAFAYPALATNDRGEIGIALGWGGTTFDANSAVGILGDFVVWYPEASDTSTTRWGDYVTARQASPQTGLFAGFAYAILKDTTVAAGVRFDPYYLLFGRQSIVNPGGGPIK